MRTTGCTRPDWSSKKAAAGPAERKDSRGDLFDVSVGWALKNQITNGTSATQFSLYENCTQTQIPTFLYRAARGGGTATAEDATHAVNWAWGQDMIDASFNGGDTYFVFLLGGGQQSA